MGSSPGPQRVPLHDYGCTLKAYRRRGHGKTCASTVRCIVHSGLRRWVGATITESPSSIAPVSASSKYGINRTIKVIFDLLTLKFLSSYSTTPIYLFGGMGAFACLGPSSTGCW